MPLCLSKTQQIVSMGGWCEASLILAWKLANYTVCELKTSQIK